MSCAETCMDRGGFNVEASTHTGKAIGFFFWPNRANGDDWEEIECSSTNNNTNWVANGSVPDPTGHTRPATSTVPATSDAPEAKPGHGRGRATLAGLLLIFGSAAFWACWALMPMPGTRDAAFIVEAVAATRPEVLASTIVQLVSVTDSIVV